MAGRRVAVSLTIASVIGGGIAGVYLGVPGLSGASTNTSQQATLQQNQGRGSAGSRSDAFDAAAKALGTTTDELRQRLSDGKTTIADIAREKNIDVNTVIDAIAAVQRDRIEDFVNNPLPTRDHTPGPGAGPGGAPGRGPGPGVGFGFGAVNLDAAAKALGITTDELRTDLRKGTSIAGVAKDKGVAVDSVIDAMVGAAQSAIDQAQTAGKITADQATRLKDGLKDRITALVNGTFRAPRPGRGGFGPGGHPGP